jgi:hypothetical protein
MFGLILKPLGMLATGNVRGLVSFLLGLVLVGALWESSLVGISTRPTATAIMTEVGAEIINPILQNHSFGLSQSLYNSLQQQAAAQPSKPVAVPGINAQTVVILGSDIKGKSFADGTRVIYGKVAEAYYDKNGQNIFNVPSQVSQIISAISLLPQAVANQVTKDSGAPPPPSVPLPPVSAIGLSLGTLTASGHAQVLSLDYWLLGAAGALALLLALFGRGWGRLTAVAWAVFSSTIPGLFGIGAIVFFQTRNPAIFAPYAGLLKAVGSAFIPVYVGAAGAAVAALLVAGVGDFAGGLIAAGRKARPAPARPLPYGSSQLGESFGGPARRPSPAPAQPYGSPAAYGAAPDQTLPYGPPSGRDAWAPAPANPQWSSAGSGSPWPPAEAEAPWGQPTPWNQPSRSGPVGPSQPSYGRQVPSEQPRPPQRPPSPYGESPYGQRSPDGPGGPAWPPQGDNPEPWPPRQGR